MSLTNIPTAGILLMLSVLLSIGFLVYGLNTLHLTLRARRYNPAPFRKLSGRPAVAIHLPIYNEFYVVGRLLESCIRVAETYGMGLVRICVIDDSTDETRDEVDRLLRGYEAKGYRIQLIRRQTRKGFKAGALQRALEETSEPYIAVLDADFVPEPDFLNRTVPYLEEEPTIGFVQGKWEHLDRGHNAITESIAIGVDGHFLIEQQGRNASGYLMNFNGSAGVIRTDAIRKSGGWDSDTLAEDLDLSYRMQLQGYAGLYLGDVAVPAELPPTITGLKRQQGRWARGSLQTARKLLVRIWRSDRLTLRQKVEAGIHLTYYLVHPLMIASFILAVVAALFSVNVISYAVNISLPALSGGEGTIELVVSSAQVAPWAVFSILIAASTLAVIFYCVEAVKVQKLGLRQKIKEITFLFFLGYGISVSNTVQALGGLFSRKTGNFARTPKYAITESGQTWRGKRYQIPFNSTMALEAGAAALALAAFVRALATDNLGILPILFIYLTGYVLVLYLTARQTLASRGQRDV